MDEQVMTALRKYGWTVMDEQAVAVAICKSLAEQSAFSAIQVFDAVHSDVESWLRYGLPQDAIETAFAEDLLRLTCAGYADIRRELCFANMVLGASLAGKGQA